MNKTLASIVTNWVPSGSKVIDFGCGDGALLKMLAEQKSIIGYGVENDPAKINSDPENEAWFCKLKIKDKSELDSLMNKQEYDKFAKERGN